jgi:hypothetical protein
VRVEGFHHEAPLVNFVRKGRGMTSITGEKVSVTQVIEAVAGAATDVGVGVAHFRALADVPAARYVFQVEPSAALDEAQGRQLLEAIERRLAGLNLEYEGKRNSQRLHPPELQVMKAGWYDSEKERQGHRLFQSKTVVLKTQEDETPASGDGQCTSRISLDAHAVPSG